MNNLHRELVLISYAARAQIEEETKCTLKRYLAGRRVADVLPLSGAAAKLGIPRQTLGSKVRSFRIDNIGSSPFKSNSFRYPISFSASSEAFRGERRR
jgi:hypothetical protein